MRGLPYEDAATFCDALRRLAGWKEIDHTLRQYIEKQVQERYFEVGEKEDYFSPFPPCTVWPELRPEDVDENLLRFACYVAVCYTVYGASYDSLTTEHILGLASQLRPDMVKELKTNGSGKLPPSIQKRKTKHLTASANDAFATIPHHRQGLHRGVLRRGAELSGGGAGAAGVPTQLLHRVPWAEKIYLPIPGLPKKGVNQLFACAVRYPRLMCGWRIMPVLPCGRTSGTKTSPMNPAPWPGTFAVFALGLEGPKWWGLVCDYLDRCDDEHSSLQEKFLHALFKKYGFTRPVPCRCWSTASSPCRI